MCSIYEVLPLRLPAMCWHDMWCAIRKLEYHMVWLHSDRQMWENILYIWFSNLTSTDTHRCCNYSLSLFLLNNKYSPVLTHLPANKNVCKLLDCSRKIQKWRSYQCISLQTRRHIIVINKNNSVLLAISVPKWSETDGIFEVLAPTW